MNVIHFVRYPIAHDPGAPPQRPQGDTSLRFGTYASGELAPTAAKTLRARLVFVEPHSGHLTFDSSPALLIVRTSCSNRFSHDLQMYS